MQKLIPAELHGFLLRLPSIPHLEAIVLFYRSPNEVWKSELLATRLYVPQRTAMRIMSDLCALGICSHSENDAEQFVYKPESELLSNLITSLVDYYAKNLIEVTNLIHARTNTQEKAQEFANAFIWRKDT
jgi:hypothetical protein